MTDNSREKCVKPNNKQISDFVAIDEMGKRVCVSGYKDNFTATYMRGGWILGYPKFDDLMDNFSEMKDMERAMKYSIDARNQFEELSKLPHEKRESKKCLPNNKKNESDSNK